MRFSSELFTAESTLEFLQRQNLLCPLRPASCLTRNMDHHLYVVLTAVSKDPEGGKEKFKIKIEFSYNLRTSSQREIARRDVMDMVYLFFRIWGYIFKGWYNHNGLIFRRPLKRVWGLFSEALRHQEGWGDGVEWSGGSEYSEWRKTFNIFTESWNYLLISI